MGWGPAALDHNNVSPCDSQCLHEEQCIPFLKKQLRERIRALWGLFGLVLSLFSGGGWFSETGHGYVT
jgi:hypothetical protein